MRSFCIQHHGSMTTRSSCRGCRPIPVTPNLAETAPRLAESGPIGLAPAKFRQRQPNDGRYQSRIWSKRLQVGRIRPDLDQDNPAIRRTCPKLSRKRPDSVRTHQTNSPRTKTGLDSKCVWPRARPHSNGFDHVFVGFEGVFAHSRCMSKFAERVDAMVVKAPQSATHVPLRACGGQFPFN